VIDILKLTCDLDILFLRAGKPGAIIEGGDIDNRLKTLFDGLTLPNEDQLPDDAQPSLDETTFFCLLESEKLISDLHVRSEELLISPDDMPDYAKVIINTTVRARELTSQNFIFGS
jgi:hypothetical protein